MKTTVYPASLLCDFYKVSHRSQYPKNTEVIYSTWTPRRSLLPEIDHVVAFGFQAFISKFLIGYFNHHFFSQSLEVVVEEYARVLRHSLGDENPDTAHIAALHKLGHLPLLIRAIPEGSRVPIRTPMLTIENTHPEFFWLTNFVESLMSAELWHPATTATIAHAYRQILDKAAQETNRDAMGFVPFQGHDFSMRGMEGLHACASGGMGHLLSFLGTDTIPAILAAEEFYGADITKELVGTSIPATEHSVMEAMGHDEKSAVLRLATEVYPRGFFSMVSDTWDLWKVLTEVLPDPEVKAAIMAREGKMVIRPDSGDPVKILCGDAQAVDARARKGVIELLWDTFGGEVNGQGFKVLDSHVGAIYGDAITRTRASDICSQLKAKGFASTNVVYGIGSYTYQFNTRDTFGFALKTTFGQFGGEKKALFKNPVTDDGTKVSQKGRVKVLADNSGKITGYVDGFLDEPDGSALVPIFMDGKLLIRHTFAEIRERLANQI